MIRQKEALSGQALFNYRGESEVPADPDGRLTTDDYYLLDLFAGIRNESWTAKVFVKNVFDEDGVIAKHPLGTDYNFLNLVPPRITGVTVSYRF